MARMAEANRAAEEAAAAEGSGRGSPAGAEVDLSAEGSEGKASPLVPRPPPYPKPADASGDPRQFAMDAALMGKGGNNVRVFTFAEIEKVLDTLPEEEPEGVDDDGTELSLTRRRKSTDEKTPRKGGGGSGGAPGSKRSFKTAGAPAAAVRGSLR